MIETGYTIVVVEEDRRCGEFLARNLTADGYEVQVAENRQDALTLLAGPSPALMVVDINGATLGLLDAVRTCGGVTGRVDPDTPVIVLTSCADALARVRVFEHDGDDVVTKPFSYPELRGLIRAVLRRCERHGPRQVVRVGNVRIDLARREVHVGGQRVGVSGKEFELLRALVSDPTRLVTREQLLRDVWHYAPSSGSRTVDSHAHRLRRKLADAGADRPLVVTVWGVGYRFCDYARAGAAG